MSTLRYALRRITSDGAAYNLDLGFVPDRVKVMNETQCDQVNKNFYFEWEKNMGSGYYKGKANQAALTDGVKMIAGTSNGFTPYDASSYTNLQKVITGISQAANAVVTITSHGYSSGAFISINGLVDGMTGLNGRQFTVTVINANTFSIAYDTTGETAYSSGGIAIEISATQTNAGFKGITLGTDVSETNADILILEAWKDETYAEVAM